MAREVETVMVGEASGLAVTIRVLDGIVIWCVDNLPERSEVVGAGWRIQRAP